MKIDFKNKNILSILIGGSIVLLSFVYVTCENMNNPYIAQKQTLKNDIKGLNLKINDLKRYDSFELGNVKDNYIGFVNTLTMLYRNTPEIQNLSITINNTDDGYLATAVQTSDTNPNIKYIECVAQINLKSDTEIEASDFYTIYKPLLYFNKIAAYKTISVEQVSKNETMYIIKFKILGK